MLSDAVVGKSPPEHFQIIFFIINVIGCSCLFIFDIRIFERGNMGSCVGYVVSFELYWRSYIVCDRDTQSRRTRSKRCVGSIT